MGTDDAVCAADHDGMQDAAAAPLFRTRHFPGTGFQAGIKAAVGIEGLVIRKTPRRPDEREPCKACNLADAGGGAQDPDRFLPGYRAIPCFPADGIHLLANFREVLGCVADVGIVVFIFLPDDRFDVFGKRFWTDATVGMGMSGNDIFDDGACLFVFRDARAPSYSDPEAYENVVDAVAGLGCEL